MAALVTRTRDAVGAREAADSGGVVAEYERQMQDDREPQVRRVRQRSTLPGQRTASERGSEAVPTDGQHAAERFGARVVATEGTIAAMHGNVAIRPLVWDKVYTGIPPTSVTAVTVPDNRLLLEGHELVIVDVGHTDTDETSVLHVPDLDLVVAGDVIYSGAHAYIGESLAVGGLGTWRDAIDKVEALRPQRIVAGHQLRRLDDDAARTIAETRQYLDDADEHLQTEKTAVDFFNAMIDRYPNHLGRTVLWSGAQAIYGVRENPDGDVVEIILSGWL